MWYSKPKTVLVVVGILAGVLLSDILYRTVYRRKPLMGGLHVVVFFPARDPASPKNGSVGDDSETKSLLRRQGEYMDSLRWNSELPAVAKVHLLCDRPDLLKEEVIARYGLNAGKIHAHGIPSFPQYRHLFQYASDFLQGELVFVVNADNLLGEGFDTIDRAWWASHPGTMYALTRHRLKDRPPGCQTDPLGYCDPEGRSIGSHDGFLFFLHRPLPEPFLKELEFKSDSYGSENVVIWAFQTILRFTVTNPCRRLVIYHNHCSEIRPHGPRERVNVDGKNAMVGFS